MRDFVVAHDELTEESFLSDAQCLPALGVPEGGTLTFDQVLTVWLHAKSTRLDGLRRAHICISAGTLLMTWIRYKGQGDV